MGPLAVLNAILPVSFAAGINFYLTVLIVGFSIRFGWVTDVPEGFQLLASPLVLITAGVLYVLEFFADKIQFVDNIWDFIHTFIRPVGAVILATTWLTGVSPDVEAIAALVAGVAALTAHSGKAGTRAAVNAASPAENVSNIVISLAEDLLVAGVVFLSILYPTGATVVTVILLALIIIFVPLLLRWTWFTLRAVYARFKAPFRKVTEPEPLPQEYSALLGGAAPELSVHCQAQGRRDMNGRYGYLALREGQIIFACKRWFRPHLWHLNTDTLVGAALRQRLLGLHLEVDYRDDRQKLRTVRFSFLQDRAPLAEQVAQRIHASSAPQSAGPHLHPGVGQASAPD